ncbi:MAG: ASCH domain-containing protein [Clostridia bacterium]|nr:ASCH domain-containing protein [Clostridia bacterium]
MKSVLISIHPKWCEMIASGKKTVEVRKTKPKLETPFKVYIYCTADRRKHIADTYVPQTPLFVKNGKAKSSIGREDGLPWKLGNGKVIGDFVCRNIDEYDPIQAHSGAIYWLDDRSFENTGFENLEDLCEYGNGKRLYGWNISNLVIYDQPKKLSEFIVPSNVGCCNDGKCRGCRWIDRGNGFNIEDDCSAPFCTDEYKPLRKAPQSWCYVEEVNR